MSSIIAKYLQKIKPSATLSLAAKAKELKSQGIDVYNLSVGEPDFDTPDNIKAAAITAINQGKTKYTPVDGLPELKDAIIKKLKNENNLEYNRDNILVSCGGKQAIFNCIMATINEGDEVIISAPYWVSYPDIVNIAKGKPIILQSSEENDFKCTAEELERHITAKTKWLILNSPSNPTGQVYSNEELKKIASLLHKYPQLHVLSDDIYEHLIYEGSFSNILSVDSKLQERVIVINGVSKAYAMTGWRIGYAAGNKEIIAKARVIQSQSTSNPCSISQYAALEALRGDQQSIGERNKIFVKRRDLAYKLLNEIECLSVSLPAGAFYLFVNCKSFLGKNKAIQNDHDFCEYLLNKAQVAVVPGSAFGMEGYFRMSYAVSEKAIAEAISKIERACKDIE